MGIISTLASLFPRVKRCQFCGARMVVNAEATYWVCSRTGCPYIEPYYGG